MKKVLVLAILGPALLAPKGSLNLDFALLSPNFGFDYQARDGFDIGLEINLPILLGSNATIVFQGLAIPGLNIGKFF
jgi:hypothetical protein